MFSNVGAPFHILLHVKHLDLNIKTASLHDEPKSCTLSDTHVSLQGNVFNIILPQQLMETCCMDGTGSIEIQSKGTKNRKKYLHINIRPFTGL